MRKILALPLLLVLLSGCKKTKKEVKCYVCEMTYSSGIPADKQYPCVDDIAKWQSEQKDNNGQPLSSECKEQ